MINIETALATKVWIEQTMAKRTPRLTRAILMTAGYTMGFVMTTNSLKEFLKEAHKKTVVFASEITEASMENFTNPPQTEEVARTRAEKFTAAMMQLLGVVE